jgi:predicted dithiol-disulfide oxidoreductase (DUF899 family)
MSIASPESRPLAAPPASQSPLPGQDPRHVGTLEPVWNMFDLTREGRQPDWDEQLCY